MPDHIEGSHRVSSALSLLWGVHVCARALLNKNKYDLAIHCKKSWRSSSTPTSGDAGPTHTGVKKSFRHPWRKFYYKYRTYCLQMSNFFDRAWIFQKQHRLGSNLQSSHPQLLLNHCATLTLCKMSYVYCIYTVYEPYARRGVGKSSR